MLWQKISLVSHSLSHGIRVSNTPNRCQDTWQSHNLTKFGVLQNGQNCSDLYSQQFFRQSWGERIAPRLWVEIFVTKGFAFVIWNILIFEIFAAESFKRMIYLKYVSVCQRKYWAPRNFGFQVGMLSQNALYFVLFCGNKENHICCAIYVKCAGCS